MAVDINFMIGGEAGQGVQSVGLILSRALVRGGYHVFADQDYESRVRGGHNFFRVRAGEAAVGAIASFVDILVALNQESIDLHMEELSQRGVAIADGEVKAKPDHENLLTVPIVKLAEEYAGNSIMANTVALGAALGLVSYDLKILDTLISEHFGAGETSEKNIKAASAGYEYVQKNHKNRFSLNLNIIGDSKPKMLITGNEAIALGAMAAGCKFISAYPMTPASSIMEYMASKTTEYGIVVIQPEDEISAVNMAIGASFAGVRSMTATSGSGFCLMVEGLGLAGITETPVVIVDAQRPGPAIGLPTRTEQGDLSFALSAHHGDFPRCVLAPANVEEAFWLTVKAFNMADKYQLPVILLTDQHLASSYATISKHDLSQVVVERGLLFDEKENDGNYMRHRITKSGISPRAFPGHEGVLVSTDSDEHDEQGHMIEGADMRTRMVQKRLRKMHGLKQEISPPYIYGPHKAAITLIGWGSTFGAIHEAVDILRKDTESIAMAHLSELWPFPAEKVADIIHNTKHSYVIENNAVGQLSQLIQMETGCKPEGKILKFDGRPFTPELIAQKIRKQLS